MAKAKAKKHGYLGDTGYFVRGWVETDEYGKPIIGRLGLRLWKNKSDIKPEGFDYIGPAILVVDLPDLSKRKV